MEKRDLDWGNIEFSYMPTDKRYVANYKDGAWDGGTVISDPSVMINGCAGILQYCQEVFEGFKAYIIEDGNIVISHSDLNAERMMGPTRRLGMPPFPKGRFLEAVDQTMKANVTWVLPFGSGATLYLRPYISALGPAIGVESSREYQFRLSGMPVGPYFKGGAKPLTLCVSDFDQAAPDDTDRVKAGLSYVMSLHASVTAHTTGHDENVFLDPGARTCTKETGGASFLFVTKDDEVATPRSDSILPSVTRHSLVHVAEHYLGPKVIQRPVELSEPGDFAECGPCGTATVISPVGKIVDHGRETCSPSGMDAMEPVTKKLCDTLTGIQMGTIEAPEGQVRKTIQQRFEYYKV